VHKNIAFNVMWVYLILICNLRVYYYPLLPQGYTEIAAILGLIVAMTCFAQRKKIVLTGRSGK
jgi:hypothetical protein